MSSLPEPERNPSSTDVPEGTRVSIFINTVLAGERGAFARSELGDCYVSGNTTELFRLAPGQEWDALVVPSFVQGAKAKLFVRKLIARKPARFALGDVLDVLEGGGVWQPQTMAQELLGLAGIASCMVTSEDIAAAAAVLDQAYARGACAKFILFRTPGKDAQVRYRDTWYTARPDRADVIEWEDEE